MENIEYLKKQISIMLNLFNRKHYDDLIYKGSLLIQEFPDQAILYNLTSLAYNALGKGIQSKRLLLEILKKQPKNFNVLNNLGLACTELNDFEQAEIYYNSAIKLNPNFTKADLLISRCITYDENNWHYKNLIERTKDRKLIEDKDIDLCYSLSKANEDFKNINQSYEFLKIGNSLRKKRNDRINFK